MDFLAPTDYTEDDYLSTVTISVNLTLPPEDLPFAVEQLEELAASEGWGITYPEG